jgi:hypothetical protein
MIRRHLDWVATARGCQRSGPWVFSQTVCRVVNTPLVRRYDRQQHDETAIQELRCCWPNVDFRAITRWPRIKFATVF